MMSVSSTVLPTIHATTVAIDGHGVMIVGASGSGKSDLALRLIDRGAVLVSDDYTAICVADGQLLASPPPLIAGKIEVRGVGIMTLPFHPLSPVTLICDLDQQPERLPLGLNNRNMEGVAVPVLNLSGFEASSPIKIEMTLQQLSATIVP